MRRKTAGACSKDERSEESGLTGLTTFEQQALQTQRRSIEEVLNRNFITSACKRAQGGGSSVNMDPVESDVGGIALIKADSPKRHRTQCQAGNQDNEGQVVYVVQFQAGEGCSGEGALDRVTERNGYAGPGDASFDLSADVKVFYARGEGWRIFEQLAKFCDRKALDRFPYQILPESTEKTLRAASGKAVRSKADIAEGRWSIGHPHASLLGDLQDPAEHIDTCLTLTRCAGAHLQNLSWSRPKAPLHQEICANRAVPYMVTDRIRSAGIRTITSGGAPMRMLPDETPRR
ncbi:hypothetical protein B0H14DRAFT_2559190 [Mycena olivaceomarginata]|nr:hypothetical protein B0H14DRAFT_2559190 [Mycena olivaceomarginata]